MKKICFIATIPAVINSFLRDHIQAASENYEVTVVCNSEDKFFLDGLNAHLVLVPIERKPSPWKDILTLIKLIKLFRHEQFDIAHSHMPKTGLLGMLAAWLVRIPIRIHTFHGEVWATRSGLHRKALKLVDQLVGLLATDVLAVSPSQQDFLVSEGVLPYGKAKVIGAGSICGVDPLRFHPNLSTRWKIRDHLKIAQNAKVILFVGRLTHDKGILDLAFAFNEIARYQKNVVLLLVGAEEDIPFNRIHEICHAERNRLHYVSFTAAPEHYMMAADIFCLPSYREGLPMTILEAAACGLPAVASCIYGITDAVEDGKTGLLFSAGDIKALTQSLLTLIDNQHLRYEMGEAARVRALLLFASHKITERILALYNELLAQRCSKS
ncbi:glycosyltransferase family 4 protein [Methylobacter sp. S3L5C]|uniref:glycosyltransferase family 4 protein n=1 Tax=Methylobacter sp. S3L5C TaxID=2839024 RepID=UPI001FAB85D6|nr:glycosyltransferase family 4 protein [Methylobacter sp. S3L5C]UOA09875.1 glycosyltransferase family 4 protein [Methylobacter sp. S3L5C]